MDRARSDVSRLSALLAVPERAAWHDAEVAIGIRACEHDDIGAANRAGRAAGADCRRVVLAHVADALADFAELRESYYGRLSSRVVLAVRGPVRLGTRRVLGRRPRRGCDLQLVDGPRAQTG